MLSNSCIGKWKIGTYFGRTHAYFFFYIFILNFKFVYWSILNVKCKYKKILSLTKTKKGIIISALLRRKD